MRGAAGLPTISPAEWFSNQIQITCETWAGVPALEPQGPLAGAAPLPCTAADGERRERDRGGGEPHGSRWRENVWPQDAEARDHERAEVERHRAVGDPFEVVGELLGHRRLVAAAHLGEAGQSGPDDEPLPVGREILGQLGEEARPDRAGADERHVAAQDVPELRDLVELRGLQPAADRGQLGLGVADELLAEELPDPLLGARRRACGT